MTRSIRYATWRTIMVVDIKQQLAQVLEYSQMRVQQPLLLQQSLQLEKTLTV